MFTIQQIKEAHSRVKTGADFPHYIHEITTLGLRKYEYFVKDGTTIYYGDNGHQLQANPIYEPRVIASKASVPDLKHAIAIHQQGQTDFLTFCRQAVEAGVEKWVIDTSKMLCTYYCLEGAEMVAEPIPQSDYK